MPKTGWRKYVAFLLSLLTYVGLFLTTIFTGLVTDANIPTFAFQLGVGIATVVGVFYAGNVLTHKYQSGGANNG